MLYRYYLNILAHHYTYVCIYIRMYVCNDEFITVLVYLLYERINVADLDLNTQAVKGEKELRLVYLSRPVNVEIFEDLPNIFKTRFD